MTKTLTKDEFFALCEQAGFTNDGGPVLSGRSEDDRRACVEEYPCGEDCLRLAALLGIEIKD